MTKIPEGKIDKEDCFMVKALKTVVAALAVCGLALSATSASEQINERELR